MIENIVFDLGGVIVPLNREACNNAFEKIGFPDFNKILNDYVQEGFFLGYEKGEITTNEFRMMIRKGIDPALMGKVSDKEIDAAMGAFLEKPGREKIELLLSLRKRYRVFLLSNTNPIAIDVVKDYFKLHGKRMEECFDAMFLSFEMGMAKPDIDIFEEMVKSGNMIPSKTLFIDDAPANVETASALGIETLLFVPGTDLVSIVNERLK